MEIEIEVETEEKKAGTEMDSVEAKQFLISQLLEEADLEKVHLSKVEKKMLHFTEVYPSLPDIYEVNSEFERDYNSDEYELKIAGLLRNARKRATAADQEQAWHDALDALRKEDHYILVMVSQAFGSWPGGLSENKHPARDFLIYVAIGIAVVLILVWLARDSLFK